MSSLFNTLSRFLIAFLPRSKHLLISWLQSSFNFMHLQWFWNTRKESLSLFPLFSPSICHEVMGPDAMIFVFWMLSFKPAFSLSSFTFIKKLFAFCHKGGVICISEIIVISPDNLDSGLCFIQCGISHVYSAHMLNKQNDNIQPSCTPFLIWNQSVVPCPVLTVASWPSYRFLRKQVGWSGIPISQWNFQFAVIHTVKGLSVVNEAEVDVSL